MAAFTRTVWTKIKDGFESPKRSTTTTTTTTRSAPPYASTTYTFNGDVIMAMDQPNRTEYVAPVSEKVHRPFFTIGVSILDVLMLIIMFIVERGTTLGTNTWITMGAKYVPCMKPIAANRISNDAGLKLRCFAFLYPYQIYRFFTPMFLHGGFRHLLNNLVYQVLVGSILERKYGTKTFAICYILFGFSGNVMSALVSPKSGRSQSFLIFHRESYGYLF